MYSGSVEKRATVHEGTLPSWRQWPKRAPQADRRLFFSFNQMLLSLVAPRLMRYQFDLMMHSVVAELFRKILVPAAVGGGGGSPGDSGSLFSSIGNLLRLRGQTAPSRTLVTTSAPAVDVQRLLDNAHKLIALQGLMHKPLEHSTSRHTFPANNSSISSRGAQERLANSSGKKQSKKQSVLQSGGRSFSKTDTQIDASANQSESPSSKANTNSDHPIQLAISTKDIISFLQNNLKQHQSAAANYNSSVLNTAKNTALHQGETSSNINHLMNSLSFGRLHTDTNEAKVGEDNLLGENAMKSLPFLRQQQTHRPEDFKISHLTFVDTEVPTYGNQVLVRDQSADLSASASSSTVDPNRSQVGLIDHSLLNEKDVHNLKSDDLERANRWNDVLVNMNEAKNG